MHWKLDMIFMLLSFLIISEINLLKKAREGSPFKEPGQATFSSSLDSCRASSNWSWIVCDNHTRSTVILINRSIDSSVVGIEAHLNSATRPKLTRQRRKSPIRMLLQPSRLISQVKPREEGRRDASPRFVPCYHSRYLHSTVIGL